MNKKSSNKAELIKDAGTILIFKATRPLDEVEHKQVSEKLRFESEKSGVKIVLMPFSVELAGIKTDDKEPIGDKQNNENDLGKVSENDEGKVSTEGSENSVSGKPDDDAGKENQ